MKKNNLILSIIFLLIFQSLCFAQNKDEVDYYKLGVDSKAVEITAKRKPYCRTFVNSDGSYTAVLAPIMGGNSQTDEATKSLSAYHIYPRLANGNNTYSNEYHIYLGRAAQGGVWGADRCVLIWNTTDIPDDATIISTSSTFQKVLQNSVATSLQFYKIVNHWNYSSLPSDSYFIWNEYETGSSGSPYSSLSIGANSTGNFTFLGSSGDGSFNTQLKSRLTANWMGLGLKNSEETISNLTQTFAFDASNGYLIVNYTTPPKLAVTPVAWVGAPGDGGLLENVLVENSGTEGETIEFTAEVSSGEDWINLINWWGSTPGSITIEVLPNFSGAARTGSVKISAKDVADLYMPISQTGLATTLTLPTQEVSGLQTYKVTDWIEANSFLVGSGGNVSTLNLYAGNKITLKPGFHAKSDAGTFLATIQSPGDNMELTGISEKDSKRILALKDENSSSTKEKTGLKTDNTLVEPIPTEYDLFQNYPNPFNPNTTIRFALPEKAVVKIAVYNLLGQQVAEIANTELNAGYHSVNFNGSALSSGIYLYRISTEKFNKTLKLLLVK